MMPADPSQKGNIMADMHLTPITVTLNLPDHLHLDNDGMKRYFLNLAILNCYQSQMITWTEANEWYGDQPESGWDSFEDFADAMNLLHQESMRIHCNDRSD
jgi:hypothetical protein